MFFIPCTFAQDVNQNLWQGTNYIKTINIWRHGNSSCIASKPLVFLEAATQCLQTACFNRGNIWLTATSYYKQKHTHRHTQMSTIQLIVHGVAWKNKDTDMICVLVLCHVLSLCKSIPPTNTIPHYSKLTSGNGHLSVSNLSASPHDIHSSISKHPLISKDSDDTQRQNWRKCLPSIVQAHQHCLFCISRIWLLRALDIFFWTVHIFMK